MPEAHQERLGRKKYLNIEALMHIEDSKREKRMYNIRQGERVPESDLMENGEGFKKGFMVVSVIISYFVQRTIQVKINSQTTSNKF